MRRLLFLMIMGLCPVVCGDEPMEVTADNAEYDGATLSLQGAVHLVHDLGIIDAEVVRLETAANGNSFQSVTMEQHVCFAMKGGGEFYCNKAQLQKESMRGYFYGADGVPVNFIEMVKGKRDSLAPLSVKSRMMEMHIGSAASKSYIDSITALEDVVVDYNRTFALTSDKAIYRREPQMEGESPFLKTLPGSIMLEPHSGNKCHATNIQGDVIESDKIVIDTNTREIAFDAPKGKISTIGAKPILFSSQHLVWDLPSKMLKLRGAVSVEQSPVGLCKSNEAMHIAYAESKGKNELRSIESMGKTFIVHYGNQKKGDQRITCSGRTFVDHEHLMTTLECLRDVDGMAIRGTEVHFRDSMGELKAEKLTLKYRLVEGKMVAEHIVAEGNVSLLGSKKDKGHCYYALANKADYSPGSAEIVCTGLTPSKRVLFYDKINSLRISAPGVKIKRECKKEIIQGIGDVRLTFAESELSEFKKHFNMDR
jgi:lipopolysaccharide export system protein LptA